MAPESADPAPADATAGGAPEAAPQTTLGWSLAVVLRRWHERTEAVLADIPHGARGYHVLDATAQGDPPTQAALAERLLIDRSVMTYLLDDLESAGLVRRRVDPDDRRVRRVCATGAGLAVLSDARRRVDRVEDHVLGGLDEADRSAFRAFAGSAAAAIQAAAPGTDPCAAVTEAVGGGSGRSGAGSGTVSRARPGSGRNGRGSRG
ncbi:MarR family winged helix-turn-helix transcriptional regulator [Nocardiopsis aegyptia]|uniref:DNA-binding MarR family transcriptional regulator n=1 Tax=Nocardiopsis aegyptia TaxID=220378 RepID=A0A7Z0JCN5_9ACTN|nr:MarR family winged helix-turn-helix transcriptional regulator [Nocardiopsis aegyptia]NYJ37638.1 DNA-binding MarR family transcriptional regulator [Nocardiopsis aegyptia]